MSENKLGNFLKYLRGSQPLRNFSEKCNISHTYLDSIEKGADPRTGKPVAVSIETLKQISNGLDVSFLFLATLANGDNYTTDLGRYLHQHRMADESFDSFAARCGVSPHSLAIACYGEAYTKSIRCKSLLQTSLSSTEIVRIANALNVDKNYLFCLYDGINPHLVNGIVFPPDDLTKTPSHLLSVNLKLFGDDDSISLDDQQLLDCYHMASPDDRTIVDSALRKYKSSAESVSPSANTAG